MAGHGNFGSLDNDPAAAMRYTECRLPAVSTAVLLADLEFDTVDFAPNFDGSLVGPIALAAAKPAPHPAWVTHMVPCALISRNP